MVYLTAVLSAMYAFAAQNPFFRAVLSGDAAAGGSTPGSLDALFETGMRFVDFAFDIFDLIIAHKVLSIFIAVGVIGLGIGLVAKFAGASKSIG